MELLADNLPGKMEVRNKDGLVQHLTGFPVGGTLLSKDTDRELGYALNNHLDFTIYLNDNEIIPIIEEYSVLFNVPTWITKDITHKENNVTLPFFKKIKL